MSWSFCGQAEDEEDKEQEIEKMMEERRDH